MSSDEPADPIGEDAPRFSFIEKLSFFPDKVQRSLAADPAGALSVVYLDLNTDVCNHSCHFCDGFHRPLQAATFTADRLLRLADEFDDVGVRAVVIAGDRGEPLMHPAAAEVIARLTRSGIAVGIYTNGTVLSKQLRAALGSVTWVRVSADAGTARTHQRMHGYPLGRNDFARMLENIGWYAREVDDVGCSFILDPANVHEIEKAADVLLPAGANFIEYKPKYLPGYRIDTEWLLAHRDAIDAAISAARARWGDQVIVNSQVHSLLREQRVPRLTVASRPCRTSLLRMVISTHGCYPCTPYRGDADHRFGDITTQSLREVLESALRRQIAERPCELMCAYHFQNEFLLDLGAGRASLPAPGREATGQDSFI